MRKAIKKSQKLRDDLWLTQGEVAEDSIRRSVLRNLDRYNIYIREVLLKKKIKDEKTKQILWEYDIIAINDSELVVVEVKNKLTQKHIEYFLEVQLPKFKKLLPEYKDYRMFWWVGGLVCKKMIICIYSELRGFWAK